MPTVTSADGTPIGYDTTGRGPALILVDGAMCLRAGGPMPLLAKHLQDHFEVYCYDRRGRGESGDTGPYAVAREVEDLQAVVAAAGGSARVHTMSSGAAIGLAAAAQGTGITALTAYEPPFGSDSPEYTAELTRLLASGARGDAVALFMAKVGLPAPVIDHMRLAPGFASLEAIAPTLAYDDAALREPLDWPAIRVPCTIVAGGASPEFLQHAARTTAERIPGAALEVLEGQDHNVDAAALAPLLITLLS
ncbi:alpha/beta fold hydrolase [Dactylosporangium matsuzakiense]|uniref:Alpha/beta hydrolase n=1 Tax=Dactylosporangium matsuzakiense TaxID=53360 RepID=A0A9W6KJD2_9ACTN|nr:alpha/beta hydrolase [Dactylosporangium matsuzakiense]UWZ46672.1 alpha/beta hydrolase [Dactylosporangium matsuzakiense]GLL01190.1 alpha/beta hydrolase [Dactylosporangium matsuzakiense]